ncbi:MAG: dockerin type I repeat-containing protein, partial [Planctomycetota bacterium]
MNRMKCFMMLAMAGTTLSLTSVASAQLQNAFGINISGATLFENFFTAPQSTNDYNDPDGNGVGRVFGSNQQLAPTGSANGVWVVDYRAVGSGNGLRELDTFGSAGTPSTDVDTQDPGYPGEPNADLSSLQSGTFSVENAYFNRDQYIDEDFAAPANLVSQFNTGNPGAKPFRQVLTPGATQYRVQTSAGGFSGSPSTSPDANAGIEIDLAVSDVPSPWFVRTVGTPDPDANPGAIGYGDNDAPSFATDGTVAGQSNKLRDLTTTVLKPASGPIPANALIDTPIAFVPISAVVNFGLGIEQATYTEVRYMFATGRTIKGENYQVATRDVGSGTRNGFSNGICLDPSWCIGENIGVRTSNPDNTVPGPLWYPSQRGGSGTLEATVINHRLGIGHTGSERGIGRWLDSGQAETLALCDDINGANPLDPTHYRRPGIDNVLDNTIPFGYNVGAPESFYSIGDPLAEPVRMVNGVAGMVNVGGDANGNPPMSNTAAANYLLNIIRSIEAFDGGGGSQTLFTPGELLALDFVLLAARDLQQNLSDPCDLVANNTNQPLQTFIRNNNVTLGNAAFDSFNTSSAGLVPSRLAGGTYSDDALTGSTQFITQGGALVPYAGMLTMRNKIAGDFNGDGMRCQNDAADMLAALAERNGGAAWVAPGGIYGGAAGGDAIIEVLGDFNGDGSFDEADVRYWADGLAMDSATKCLDRCEGFRLVDSLSGGDFFGYGTHPTGAAYQDGDASGDMAGPSGLVTPNFNPIGHDLVVDDHDIDYVYAQFKDLADGELDWANEFNDAIGRDLSADVNGDLLINQDDVCKIVNDILETTFGDVNLDGVADATDISIVTANQGLTPAGWADGDLNGDDIVDGTDLLIADGTIDPCAPAITGSCCFGCAGTTLIACQDGIIDVDCIASGGKFGGQGSLCSGSPCSSFCEGDILGDGNGDVTLADFTALANNFGLISGGDRAVGEFNCDGSVNLA